MKDRKDGKNIKSGFQIYNHRMSEFFWGLEKLKKNGAKMANIANLKEGDKVVIYWAGKNGHCFLGSCVLASIHETLSPEREVAITHEAFFDWKQGVSLKKESIDNWGAKSLHFDRLRRKVSFVPLQGSVQAITKSDYDIIVSEHELTG